MKKQFVVGGIYNSIYTGSNEAYAEINGKWTFIVTATAPTLQFQVLFDKSGSVFSDELRSNTITARDPESAFIECEVYEVTDKKEYFIKSQFMTLQEALSENLITPDEIKKSLNRVAGMGSKGYSIAYFVEGRSKKNPYLQRVFVKWSSRKKMMDDFKKHGALY